MTAEQLWLWADRASILIGIFLAIPVFWTWWQLVIGERRQRRRWLAEITRKPGNRPGVLLLDLLPGKSIEASVRAFLASTPALNGLPDDRFVIVRRNEAIMPKNMETLARDVRAAARHLLNAGCDVIHLFHGGPDVSALIVGAELSNGPRVLLYHYEQGGYKPYGPLEQLRPNA